MIISFAWTTDALLAGRKTCTRRNWSAQYAGRFRAGTYHKAYNRQARYGGHKVGEISIAVEPYPEPVRCISDDDFENEGFAWMQENGLLIRGITPRQFFVNWRASDEILYVVRFRLVAVERTGR